MIVRDARLDDCEACGRLRELVARRMYRTERALREFGYFDLGGES